MKTAIATMAGVALALAASWICGAAFVRLFPKQMLGAPPTVVGLFVLVVIAVVFMAVRLALRKADAR